MTPGVFYNLPAVTCAPYAFGEAKLFGIAYIRDQTSVNIQGGDIHCSVAKEAAWLE